MIWGSIFLLLFFLAKMCDTFACTRKHYVTKLKNGNLRIKPKEFLLLADCLINQRKIFCQTCNKCNECRDLLSLLRRYHEIEFEVRKIPGNYIVYLEFNKLQNYLQLEYAKIFHTINEAKEMGVFLFKKKNTKNFLLTFNLN